MTDSKKQCFPVPTGESSDLIGDADEQCELGQAACASLPPSPEAEHACSAGEAGKHLKTSLRAQLTNTQ